MITRSLFRQSSSSLNCKKENRLGMAQFKDIDARRESPAVLDDDHLLAARIAQKLRDAGIKFESINLVPTNKAVLDRDRFAFLLMLTLLTVLAWGYLLWLWVDMGMGGMDMTGFRTIPSGTGLMIPTHIAVAADGVRMGIRHVDRDDGRHDDAVGGTDVSHVRPHRAANGRARQATCCDCLVRCWLFPCMGRFLGARYIGAMGT